VIDIAINNNVHLCQSVADAHGIPTITQDGVWMSTHPMPPYYPNLITIDANTDIDEHIASLHKALEPGWGIKDSFARFDLADRGFTQVIDGQWFVHPTPSAVTPLRSSDNQLKLVDSDECFMRWLMAWDADMAESVFPLSVWRNDALSFLSVERSDEIVAGLLLNDSSSAMGLSNWFGDINAVQWALHQTTKSDKPVVGYTDNDEWPSLQAFGYHRLQPMRVWISL